MSEKAVATAQTSQPAPENFSKLLREKDKIIKIQARRIDQLHREITKLRLERDSLNSRVTVLTFKLAHQNKTTNSAAEVPPPPPPRSSSIVREKSTTGSVENSPHLSPRVGRQRSVSGNARPPQRQRSQHRRCDEEDKIKKSRGWANVYELSQDLHDKQLEMLERKYGGQLRARRAARVIQQAFRQYCMNKNFQKLRTAHTTERRLSRRLSELGRSNTIWCDNMVMQQEMMMGGSGMITVAMKTKSTTQRTIDIPAEIKRHMDNENLHQMLVAAATDRINANKQAAPMLAQQKRSHTLSATEHVVLRDRKQHLTRSMGLDLSSIRENMKGSKCSTKAVTTTSPEETNNNRNSYPELNDSSASDSPQDTPVEPMVDLPSVNFENLLESRETDILNDSFHSDGSNETGLTPNREHAYGIASPSDRISAYSVVVDSDQTPTNSMNRTYERFRSGHSECSDSTTSITSGGEVQIRIDGPLDEGCMMLSSDSDRTPTQDDGTLTKIYANTEVKLRNKKRTTSGGPGAESKRATTPAAGSSQGHSKLSPEASPIWKRKSAMEVNGALVEDAKRMSNISEASEPESMDSSDRRFSSSSSSDTTSMASMGSEGGSISYSKAAVPIRKASLQQLNAPNTAQGGNKLNDKQRKRMYRMGLNLFNKKPEKGIRYMIERKFIDDRPLAVAKFLMARKGLSKQMIGEYLGNLQKEFNMQTLDCFSDDIDLAGLQVDVALRKFQSYFRMPGEAQKIERLMEAFASRYCMCNPDQIKKFKSADSVFLLAFAIIMLNTDLHNSNIKAEKRMKADDFIRNLRGIDDGEDIDRDMLLGIYERIRAHEFKAGTDHVVQVMKVEQMLVGKKPQLSLPHRRLVCYCRLYEVHDPAKKEKAGLHQREVFLFNDILMVTKIFSKKKNNVTYSPRHTFQLCGMVVSLFQTPHYQHGIRLSTNIDGKSLMTFNARNEHDRSKFVEDLREAIAETNEMEAYRIDEELQKQSLSHHTMDPHRFSKDSGVMDIELLKPSDPGYNRLSAPECGGLKKTTLSNSLIDLSETQSLRRGSGGSLDSGMVSSSSGSTTSREDSPHGAKSSSKQQLQQSASFRIAPFISGKKSKTSKASLQDITSDCSEV